jgi:hypothetical protein
LNIIDRFFLLETQGYSLKTTALAKLFFEHAIAMVSTATALVNTATALVNTATALDNTATALVNTATALVNTATALVSAGPYPNTPYSTDFGINFCRLFI